MKLHKNAKEMLRITDQLLAKIKNVRFKFPVEYVYNPLSYARKGYTSYIEKFAKGDKKILMIGMNPGPWGMVQTGIPFGEVSSVKKWMHINEVLTIRPTLHLLRPVDGLECKRSEVSGLRLWSWAKKRFKTAKNFFKNFIVLNYCPLAFIETSGRNRSLEKLPIKERQLLFNACDNATKEYIELFNPEIVIGVGVFAWKRIKIVSRELNVKVGKVTHPSPANPKANKGWSKLIDKELEFIGLNLNDYFLIK